MLQTAWETWQELDYEIEASHQRRFAQTVEDCDLIRETIVVPEILFANRRGPERRAFKRNLDVRGEVLVQAGARRLEFLCRPGMARWQEAHRAWGRTGASWKSGEAPRYLVTFELTGLGCC